MSLPAWLRRKYEVDSIDVVLVIGSGGLESPQEHWDSTLRAVRLALSRYGSTRGLVSDIDVSQQRDQASHPGLSDQAQLAIYLSGQTNLTRSWLETEAHHELSLFAVGVTTSLEMAWNRLEPLAKPVVLAVSYGTAKNWLLLAKWSKAIRTTQVKLDEAILSHPALCFRLAKTRFGRYRLRFESLFIAERTTGYPSSPEIQDRG